MNRYKVLERFYSICAVVFCAMLLIFATLASAAARMGLGTGALSAGAEPAASRTCIQPILERYGLTFEQEKDLLIIYRPIKAAG